MHQVAGAGRQQRAASGLTQLDEVERVSARGLTTEERDELRLGSTSRCGRARIGDEKSVVTFSPCLEADRPTFGAPPAVVLQGDAAAPKIATEVDYLTPEGGQRSPFS